MDQRPCLVVAYADSAFAARWGRFFRRQGWEVHFTRSDAPVGRLVEQLHPAAVVIDAEVAGAVGAWNQEHPDVELVRVGAAPEADGEVALEHLQARLLAVA